MRVLRLMAGLAAFCCLASAIQADDIHDAIQEKNLQRIRDLLKDDPALAYTRNAEGRSPFEMAVIAESRNIVILLTVMTDCAYMEECIDGRTDAGRDALQSGLLKKAHAILSDSFRQYPDNEKINFAYGLACYSLGDFSRAELAYQRVLQLNPHNGRARAELGRSYLDRNQPILAQQEFTKALKDDPSAAARERIEASLSEIEKRSRRWTFEGCLSVGYLNDDNVNVGPDSETVGIAPIIFGAQTYTSLEVDEETKPVHAWGGRLAFSLSETYDVGECGEWYLRGKASYYQNALRDEPDHETMFCEVTLEGRRVGPNSCLAWPVRVSHISHGHEPLITMFAFDPEILVTAGLRRQWQWSTRATMEMRDYDELDDRDGVFVRVSETATRQCGRSGSRVLLDMAVFQDRTDADVYEYIGAACGAGGDCRLSWSTTAYLRGHYRTAHYAERETLAPENRKDDQVQVLLGIRKKLSARWGIDFNFQWTRNDSTFDLYEYNRSVMTASTSVVF